MNRPSRSILSGCFTFTLFECYLNFMTRHVLLSNQAKSIKLIRLDIFKKDEFIESVK